MRSGSGALRFNATGKVGISVEVRTNIFNVIGDPTNLPNVER
jgi:hypothetical protein